MLTSLLLVAATMPAVAAPPCRASALALSLDGKDGDFNGMSHSGTLVVLRNRERLACTVPALPRVTMLGHRGRVLPIARQAPAGMHPGPVMAPLTLAPGAAASTPLRWVSGEVFDHSRCFSPARLAVAIGAGSVGVPLVAHVCGRAGEAATFEQPPLAPMKRAY